jgi:hypothetical protein
LPLSDPAGWSSLAATAGGAVLCSPAASSNGAVSMMSGTMTWVVVTREPLTSMWLLGPSSQFLTQELSNALVLSHANADSDSHNTAINTNKKQTLLSTHLFHHKLSIRSNRGKKSPICI